MNRTKSCRLISRMGAFCIWSNKEVRAGASHPFIAIAVAIFAIVVMVCPVFGAGTTLEVNLKNGTTNPVKPTINLWSNDSIGVRFLELPTLDDSGEQRLVAFFDIPTWEVSQGKVSRNQDFWYTATDGLTLRFHLCKDTAVAHLVEGVAQSRAIAVAESRKDFLKDIKREQSPSAPPADVEPESKPCGFAVHDDGAPSWTIVARAGTIALVIGLATVDEAEPGGLRLEKVLQSVLITLEESPFDLEWSLGASFLKIDSERYRLAEIEGDAEHRTLLRASDKNSTYEFAAFAHYMSHRFRRRLGLSAGVGLNLPVDTVTLLAGGSVSFRTRSLPNNTNAYLTLGYAYTLRDRLRPEYEGITTVASTVTADSVVEQRYGGVWFAAVTFGFLGGEGQFTGVYSGSSKKGKETESSN